MRERHQVSSPLRVMDGEGEVLLSGRRWASSRGAKSICLLHAHCRAQICLLYADSGGARAGVGFVERFVAEVHFHRFLVFGLRLVVWR